MNNFNPLILYMLAFVGCTLVALPVSAQVFPGDANNNGEVDNVDLLYIGYAYGEFGPARLDVGVEFASQTILLPWQQNFPLGPNFAYADTDGDGLVDLNDLLTVFINYGETTGTVIPIEYPLGTLGFDPMLDLHQDDIPDQLIPGSVVQIPIVLGSEELPIENINGIAFSIRYNQEIVQSISLELNAPWLSPDVDGALFHFQNFPVIEEGVLDVAMTRFGQQPVSGYGEIGKLSIVIEDDLLDLLPDQNDSLEVVVEIEEIFMLNQDFETVPVVPSDVTLMLYHPNAITATKEPAILNMVSVSPNPSNGLLQICAPVEIKAIRVMDMLGQEQFFENGNGRRKIKINTNELPIGMSLVQIQTDAGLAVRKIFITSSH